MIHNNNECFWGVQRIAPDCSRAVWFCHNPSVRSPSCWMGCEIWMLCDIPWLHSFSNWQLFIESFNFKHQNGICLSTTRACPGDRRSHKSYAKLHHSRSNVSTFVQLCYRCSHNLFSWICPKKSTYFGLRLGRSVTSKCSHHNFDWTVTANSSHSRQGTWNDDPTILATVRKWSKPSMVEHSCPISRIRCLVSSECPVHREGLSSGNVLGNRSQVTVP